MIEKGKKYFYNQKGTWCIIYLRSIKKINYKSKYDYYIDIKFTPPISSIDEMGDFKLCGSSFCITKTELEIDFREYNKKERFLCMIENL